MSTYTEGLRKLAGFIDENGFEDVIFHADGMTLSVFPPKWNGKDMDKAHVARILKAFGGKWDKAVSGTSMTFKQSNVFEVFTVNVYAAREAICERRVLGVETIEHTAQPAMEAYVEEREIIEWDCGTLLAPAKKELVAA